MDKLSPNPCKSYFSCSNMKSNDIGSVLKSLEEVKEKLQGLRSGYDGVMHPEAAAIFPSVYRRFGSSPVPSGRGKSLFVPLFNGGSSRAFVSWLYDVECYFNAYNFSDEMKCDIVVSCLKGFGLLWYNSLELSRKLNGNEKIRSWCKLRMLMKDEFVPSSFLDVLWTELKTLKQNSLSVDEYARLFEELHFVCDGNVECVQKGVRFHYGLNSEISKQINLFMKYTFDEMYEFALIVESTLAKKIGVEALVDECCESSDDGLIDLCIEKEEHQGCDVSLHSSIVNSESEVLYGVPNSSASVGFASLTLYRPVCFQPFEWLTCFNETMIPQKLKSYAFGIVYYKGDLFSFVPTTCSQNLTTYSTYKHPFQTTKMILGEGNTRYESLNLSGDRFGKELNIVEKCFVFTRETQSERVTTITPKALLQLGFKNAATCDDIKSLMMKYKGNVYAGCLRYNTRGKGIELEDVMLSRLRYFMKVFDPGGGSVFHLWSCI